MPCNTVPDALAASAPATCPSCSYVCGAAVAFGLLGMAEAIKAHGPRWWQCAECGYAPDRDGQHPNEAYDNTIYRCTDGLFCGPCADRLQKQDASQPSSKPQETDR